jgi:hypothetical protein
MRADLGALRDPGKGKGKGKGLFENQVSGGVGRDSEEEVRCCEERGEQAPRPFARGVHARKSGVEEI